MTGATRQVAAPEHAHHDIHMNHERGKDMRTKVGATLVALLLVVVVAACGSSSDSSTTTSTSGSGGEGGFSLDEPMKIVSLIEIEGESPAANNNIHNGIVMAVDEINAAGGVGGKPISLDRVTAPLNPQGHVSAVLKAQEMNPTVMIGLATTAGIAAVAPSIADGGIPVLSALGGDQPASVIADSDGWLFQPIASSVRGVAPQSAVDYATTELGAKKLAVLYTDAPYGKDGKDTIVAYAKEKGVDIVLERSSALDATDLTEEVIAVKESGADAVLNWMYPNPLAVQLNQFQQNGLDIPTVASRSGSFVFTYGTAAGPAISKLYGIQSCNPGSDSPEWAKKYEEKFGQPSDDAAASTYDEVHIAVAAVLQAQTTEPEAVRSALEELTYTDGICSTDYHVQGDANVMNHNQIAVSFAGETPKTVAHYSG